MIKSLQTAVKIMENTIAEISTQTSTPIISSSKMTYEDFLREYNGQYAEYVDGEVIKPMTVTKTHSKLTHFLSSLLQFFVESKRLGQIYGEPYQMKMNLEGKTKSREPDVFFVATENFNRVNEQYFEGAADLIIEVISPESIIRDTQDKFEEYEAAGVKEYWIIDPNRRTANFYNLEENGKYKLRYPSAEDKFESRIIEGLWIKTDWLWQENLPDLMEVLKEWKLV
jgi:Uma2 family endonuclease